MSLPSKLLSRLYKRGIINKNDIKQHVPNNQQDVTETSFIFCPNKYNIYHDCSSFCQTYWRGFASPDPRYAKNIKIALAKYPLPIKWEQVFDKGVGRYYYWNTETDMISWLPPAHPKAIIGESADKKRQRRKKYLQEAGNSKRSNYKYGDRRRSRQADLVDPMDPSAYSDVPRGSWSDGLEQNRGFADNTAAGALFQQRPYPSPGDILALNKKTFRLC